MCLAVPVQITKIVDDNTVEVQIGENNYMPVISALLMEEFKVGDYVITHAGYALRVLDLQEAEETLKIFHSVQ